MSSVSRVKMQSRCETSVGWNLAEDESAAEVASDS